MKRALCVLVFGWSALLFAAPPKEKAPKWGGKTRPQPEAKKPGPKVPTPEEEAEGLSDTAAKEYGKGRYNQALSAWQKAYRLNPLPDYLFNIAQCYHELDRKQDALDAYRAYLDLNPSVPYRDLIEERITSYEIVLQARGDAEQIRKQTHRRAVRNQLPRWMFRGSLFAGGVGLAAGGAGLGLALSSGALQRGGELNASIERRDSALALGVASEISFGVAAAAGTAALVFYFTRPDEPKRSPEEEPSPEAVPTISLGPTGFSLHYRF